MRSLSVMACSLLLWSSIAPAAGNAHSASLSGSLHLARTGSPLSGATVRLVAPSGGTGHASRPSGPQGRFSMGGVEPGVYRVAVDDGGRRFIMERPITLRPGARESVRLLVAPAATPTHAGVWDSPTAAGAIVAGSAIALGLLLREVTSDESTPERPASPTAP